MSFAFFENHLRAIRSLLTFTPSSLIRVLRSFKKKQGYLFPHRRLGFSSPEECLRESGEFNMFKRGNEDYIYAKRDEEVSKTRTERIRALMRRQAVISIVAKRLPERRHG